MSWDQLNVSKKCSSSPGARCHLKRTQSRTESIRTRFNFTSLNILKHWRSQRSEESLQQAHFCCEEQFFYWNIPRFIFWDCNEPERTRKPNWKQAVCNRWKRILGTFKHHNIKTFSFRPVKWWLRQHVEVSAFRFFPEIHYHHIWVKYLSASRKMWYMRSPQRTFSVWERLQDCIANTKLLFQ